MTELTRVEAKKDIFGGYTKTLTFVDNYIGLTWTEKRKTKMERPETASDFKRKMLNHKPKFTATQCNACKGLKTDPLDQENIIDEGYCLMCDKQLAEKYDIYQE